MLAVAGIHMVSNPSATKDNVKLQAKIDKAKNKPKKIQAARFFACLGIAGAGKGTGKALVEHFKDFNRILDATTEELIEVPDVGETTAKVINAYLDSDGYKVIADLLEHVELELPKTGPLSGSSFCFSGGFEGGKRKWELKVEELGGTIKSSVGKSTTYLVEGENAGSKVAKATGYGVTILSIDDLEGKLK
jgi:DNA ligase (NAD+)